MEHVEVTFDNGRKTIVQRCESFHMAPECEFEHYERCSLPTRHRGVVHVAIHDNLTSSWSTPTGDTFIFKEK